MQKLLYFSLTVYCIFYAFESPIRYGLSFAHADAAIFIRDALLALPLAGIAIRQILERRLHPAFIAFFAIVGLHGVVMVLNTHSVLAVLYSAKMLMGMLAGAVASAYFFAPSRRMVMFFLVLWAVCLAGIAVDKYYADFPWTGMQTDIDGVQVDVSRNWQVTGDDKRAGGFMRSSINAAIFMPLLAFLLLFQQRNPYIKAVIAVGTAFALYWTTQKGAIIAYMAVLACLVMPPPWRLSLLRMGFFAFLNLMVALPLVLPGLHMPHADAAMMSFNLRVDATWPQGWRWIARHQAFPFGIGLGGLGGAQRLWSPGGYTVGDNMFLFLYANFGFLSLAYLGWLAVMVIRTRAGGTAAQCQAMATLMFLIGYGCVLTVIEDQMALLFLGASAAWLAMALIGQTADTRLQEAGMQQKELPAPALQH
jgi:hypothetical protein